MAGYRTVLVQHHQVVRADVHAGRFVLTFAAVALISTYKCRHGSFSVLFTAVISSGASAASAGL
jgi:hypothetical protein